MNDPILLWWEFIDARASGKVAGDLFSILKMTAQDAYAYAASRGGTLRAIEGLWEVRAAQAAGTRRIP